MFSNVVNDKLISADLPPAQIQNRQGCKDENVTQRIAHKSQHIHFHGRIVGTHPKTIDGVRIAEPVTTVCHHKSQNAAQESNTDGYSEGTDDQG